MATILQIDANRRNAQKSTGPKTPEGKTAVRMNAIRHGLRARTVVLPGEDRQEFHQLCGDLELEWQPQSRTEQFYLEQMAVSQWKLNRMEAGEANLCKDAVISKSQVPLLDRLWQAQSRMERSYSRAQRELERLQASRRHDANVAQTSANPAVVEAAVVEMEKRVVEMEAGVLEKEVGEKGVLEAEVVEAEVVEAGVVGQAFSPANPTAAAETPNPTATPVVKPDPRTAGRPHQAPSHNSSVSAALS